MDVTGRPESDEEVIPTKKRLTVVLIFCALLLSACSNSAGELTKWDCSVVCASDSTDTCIITYGDEEVIPTGEALTFQNRNDFDIVVHLLTGGEEERISEVPAGGAAVLYQLEKGTHYTVGCHAEVEEGTEIRLMVYDGEGAEPFT